MIPQETEPWYLALRSKEWSIAFAKADVTWNTN